jgi:ABC-type thiamin/hydroxymethylpyrimidine transport system permease subunit
MKSAYTVRSWVTIGLFGALWGVVELTLGSVLHLVFPPQMNTFVTGVVLGGVGALIALTGRHFVPNPGSVLFIGIVTALIKLLSPGGARLGPIVAILMQGLLMELSLWAGRRPRRWSFVLGGALAVAWNLPHKFIMMRLLFGRGILQVYTKMVQDGARMLALDVSAAVGILAILLLVRLVVGGIAGWGAWELGGAVASRLGWASGPSTQHQG